MANAITARSRKLCHEAACELSVVMPCLNEAATLARCIDKAQRFLRHSGVAGEIIVADNGSTDGSQAIAEACGARLVHVAARGYGSALKGGIEAARGCYVIMGDADDSYDFEHLEPFLERLRAGHDLVMGNRFRGGIKTGAMPALHRYLGNPVLTGLGRLFFRCPIGDFHCGLRGFNKAAIASLDLQTQGMEFASEMVVKATLFHLRVSEVPTTLAPDGRSRPPHLRRWRDGWRHLRFLLLFSPRWLFLYPGLALLGVGLSVMLWLLPQPRTLGAVTFDIHTMLYAAVAILLGLQSAAFAVLAKFFTISHYLLPQDDRFSAAIRQFSLERGLIIGGLLSCVGLLGSVYALVSWGETSFGPLVPSSMMRLTIPSLTALASGIQLIFMSFFLSILSLKQPL